MTDRPVASQVIGIEIDNSTLKAIVLKNIQNKPVLEKAYAIDIQGQEADSEKHLDQSQSNGFRKHLNKDLVISGLNADTVLIRSFESKLKKERDIDSTLQFQVEPLLPFPIEEALIDRVIVSPLEDGTDLTLFIVKKESLQDHLDQWHELKIDPEVIGAVPNALAQFCKLFCREEGPCFVVNIGVHRITCDLVKNGKLIAAQACRQGLKYLMEAYQQDRQSAPSLPDFSNLDFARLDGSLAPHLIKAFEQMKLEVNRILFALSKSPRAGDANAILVTGAAGKLTDFSKRLFDKIKKKVIYPEPSENFSLSSNDLQYYAVPIGLALSGLPKIDDLINFRQEEYAFPNPWKRFKQPLGIFLGLCLLLAICLYFLGSSYITGQKNELRQEYARLLGSINKSFSQVENEYLTKNPSENGYAPDSIGELSQEQIIARVNFIENSLKTTPDVFPLLPNLPRVSDVMAWLMNHPSVVHREDQTGVVTPLLEIESVTYTYVKRPDLARPRDRYQVRMDLEFTSSSPKQAREFHDSLIGPNDFVDPKNEVKWSVNKNRYRASFYLKDKTVYPSS